MYPAISVPEKLSVSCQASTGLALQVDWIGECACFCRKLITESAILTPEECVACSDSQMFPWLKDLDRTKFTSYSFTGFIDYWDTNGRHVHESIL